MAARLLFVGDIHLGRSPSGLPDELLSELGLARRELGPATAWRRAVELALAERVDAVLLAGDVVEAEDDFFEAYPKLKEGVARLVNAGIDTIAVAGNHDVRVLPRLADEIRGLVLLGRRGRWETHVVRREGVPIARVLGWSFPERVVRTSPFADFPPAWDAGGFGDDADDALPTVGLVHADLDQSGSAYAPVRRSELAVRGLAGWLVGHVHEPDWHRLAAARPIGYLGSITGLDPTERGVHGPWFGELDAMGLRLAQRPLAPLRWEELDLPLEAFDGIEQLDGAVLAALRARHAELAPSLAHAQLVGLRLHLVGASRIPRAEIERWLAASEGVQSLRDELEGVRYFVERAENHSRPALPLAELARERDPVGLLAQRLLALEAAGAEGDRLLGAARAALGAASELRHPSVDLGAAKDDELRELLLATARSGIEELLLQRNALRELLGRRAPLEVGA